MEKMEEVKATRFSIKNTYEYLKNTKLAVYETYLKYNNLNKRNDLLDSFHFQSKLIDLEFDTIKQVYLYIDNHIYCDYYKLFVIVNKFYMDNFKEEITINKYPVYKDLEPYKEYDYDTINNIHQDIIKIISTIEKNCNKKDEEIKEHHVKLANGINIDHFILNLEYSNNILRNQNGLYKKYLSSYHKYHISWLTNLKDKIDLMKTQLNNDININDVVKEKVSRYIKQKCILCDLDAVYCEDCAHIGLRNVIVNEIPQPLEVPELVLEPVVESVPGPVIESVPEPVVELVVVEPVIESVPEPFVEPVVEPVIESVPEPVVELVVVKPLIESAPEPVVEPVVESVVE